MAATTEPQPASTPNGGALQTAPAAHVHLDLAGPLGQRVQANLEQWLLVAPRANPGMIEMFHLRDRQPLPALVPWAGEFAGKYLISAIQARAMTTDPRLDATIRALVAELIAAQAEDGYLGPFPKADRLLGNWDLWGHYHVMLGLGMWYEQTGDTAALACARRAADLICRTYLGTPRKVADAGSHEMNMAVIHVMARLYRQTGEPRYLAMARQIADEWQGAGDYLRKGLAGVPFAATPSPRWESLHDLQGLVELYRATGEAQYRDAFMRLWHSIRERDRHPDGGFTSGEQAIGNPYGEGAIETCCVVAWMCITADMLQLTDDPRVADELELTLWNAILGAQHPSGRWWTYNTPINGTREASAHTIVFQSRFGTPELNCCSVNAPRGLGMLADWAVTSNARGLAVNFYGPGRTQLALAGGTTLTLTQETSYPATGAVALKLGLAAPTEFTLRLRIPAWSAQTKLSINGQPQPAPRAGSYAELNRTWRKGDTITLDFDMSPRHWTGSLGRRGMAALYAGPLLLAYDQHDNAADTTQLPTLDVAHLKLTPEPVAATAGDAALLQFSPLVRFRAQWGEQHCELRDFASAGAQGSHYAAWLPASGTRPTPNWRLAPLRDQAAPAGPVLFEWSPVVDADNQPLACRLQVAREADFSALVIDQPTTSPRRTVVERGLEPSVRYYWRVVANNEQGETASVGDPWSFTLDPALPNQVAQRLEKLRLASEGRGPDHELLSARIANGQPESASQLQIAAPLHLGADQQGKEAGAFAFAGQPQGAVRFSLAAFPETDYTFTCWFNPADLQRAGLQHLASCWHRPYDDPLRLTIENGQLYARVEAGIVYGAPGVTLHQNAWQHAAVVKQGPMLALYLNGARATSIPVPESIASDSQVLALGGNPQPVYPEAFAGHIAGARLLAKALTPTEIQTLFEQEKPKP